MTPLNKRTVAVLGAGITGLTAARALSQKGIRVTLYEQGDTVGGVIQSRQSDGWLMELGPNTIMVRSRKVWELLDELGLNEQMLEAGSEAKKRFVVYNDKAEALPMSLTDFITTPIFSAKAKLRLFREPFISASGEEESIARFVERRLGEEILDYAVNPFVAGIFAGDPQKLSLRHTFPKLHEFEKNHGSLFKGMFKGSQKNPAPKALISFRDGLAALPEALHEQLGNTVKLKRKVSNIRHSARGLELRFENGGTAEHDAVISTIPLHKLASCFAESENSASKPAQELTAVSYAPLSVLHLGYHKKQIRHPLDGFGMLVPEKENYDLLGALFSSSLFPGRAPEGYALLTCFIGGSRNPELAGSPKDRLVEKAQGDLDRLLGIEGTPKLVRHTFWEKAIPQYEVGYSKYLKKMNELESEYEGLFLAGNFRGGVSVPDCISGGFETAEKAALFLEPEG